MFVCSCFLSQFLIVRSPLLFQLQNPSSSPISIINVALNFPNASYGPTPSSLLFKIQVPSLFSHPVFLTFPNPSSICLQPSCLPYFSKSILHLPPAFLSPALHSFFLPLHYSSHQGFSLFSYLRRCFVAETDVRQRRFYADTFQVGGVVCGDIL